MRELSKMICPLQNVERSTTNRGWSSVAVLRSPQRMERRSGTSAPKIRFGQLSTARGPVSCPGWDRCLREREPRRRS